MYCRVLRLGFENVKRIFHKKTSLAALVGLAFLIGYSSTLFIIGESDLETTFSSNEFILYFFNDIGIAGMYLNMLFVIFISGMFQDDINYIYLSRLKNKTHILLSWLISIFLSSIIFISFLLIILLVTAGIIKDYSSLWSSTLVEGSFGMHEITELFNPINSIVISTSLNTIGFIIIGICFYIGYVVSKSYIGGVIFNFAHILIGLGAYFLKIGWLGKISLNINTIFVLNSLNKNGNYPSFLYSIIYFFTAIGLLYVIASKITNNILGRSYKGEE